MFAHCKSPVWRVDDFTMCFRQDYLLVLFPLVACGLSLSFLVVHGMRQIRQAGHAETHDLLRSSASKIPISTSGLDVAEETNDENAPLALAIKSSGEDAVEVEVNRPRRALFILAIELVCLLGLVGISLAILSTGLWEYSGKTAAVASLATWVYISVLAYLKLFFQTTDNDFLPNIWNHTAYLYCLQWGFTAIVFRTVLIHPPPKGLQFLVIASFVLITILALLALGTRRGNKTVVLLREGDVEPSQEPLASIASILTFSWVDPIVLKGWKNPLQIGDVWNLLPKEKPIVVLASFRRYHKTTGLAIHLIKFFGSDLLFQQFWAFLSGLFTFAPTLLLKVILEYVEHPEITPISTAWLYVVLLLVCSCITGIAEGQALWRGRKICIKLRAVMIGEIYSKTLRRKAASSGDTDMNTSNDMVENQSKAGKHSWWKKPFGKKKSTEANEESAEVAKEKNGSTQVNSGTIINLMSVDSFRVSEISAYWHFLIPTVPVQLVVAIYLLFRFLGWSAVAGICVMIAVMPLNIYFSNRFSYAHKKIMSATDSRIHTTNEVLQNVRIIKFFAWEDRFATNINDKRVVELAAVRYRFSLWAAASVVWFGVPMIITAFSFFLYTMVEKKPLVPSVAFTALSLFGLLRYPLDRFADMLAHVLESRVSVARVEKFLDEDETGKYEQLTPVKENTEDYIGFKNATFSWGQKNEPTGLANPAFRMINLNVKFKARGLNIIAGPTGSGKTSMLMALLGEMTLINGSVHLPGGYDRALLKQDDDGLTESVAYCAQQAWLVNDTIKQNIIFASPLDEHRYQSVIEACALKRDLEILDGGDSTLVGEKGIVVSGGQKQRISLARALYSKSRHIILDDCLSAVDSHTAQHIYEHCVVGPLMEKRTCILVTHNIALCVPRADHVVVLANGKISGQGPPDKIRASGVLGDEMQNSQSNSRPGTREQSRAHSLTDLNGKSAETDGKVNGHTNDLKSKQQDLVNKQDDIKDANIRVEDKAEGAVDWRVVSLYLRSMGPWYFWVLILLGFTGENIASVATNVWIRQWANSYHTEFVGALDLNKNASDATFLFTWLAPVKNSFLVSRTQPMQTSARTITSSTVDVRYYLTVYVVLTFGYILVCLFRLGVMFKGSLKASRKIHSKLLESVLRAKFKFFDTTPLGQIMNRFSKDLQAVDQDVAPVAAGVLQTSFGIISIVVLISIITPGFLFAGAFLTILYIGIGAFYIRASRDLKRLESTQRSPLYQQFGETLSGVTTIRAYGDERRFIDDNAQRINTYNRPFIYLWAANRWLALRVDFAGALVSFCAASFIVAKAGSIDAGAAGLSLTYALGFNENILWLVRLYAENEQNMNHVERVKTFLEVEQEAPAHIPAMRPTGNWPSKGAIKFENYTTRYRRDLDPVLRNLSFEIQPEQKVGIVGRTGAGKSSLALAMFRGLEADSGKISIDNVDISTIGLQDLRENLTIVPQDPTLFTGTIRSNLDPFNLFTDEEIFVALRRVHLISVDSFPPIVLDSTTNNTVPGSSFSQPSLDTSALEEMETSTATTDLSAPATLCRSSLSVPAATDENLRSTSGLAKVTTNTRENTNVFLNLSSLVSESGSNLSQGQRQLLCLARALLKSPRVLLMDEATASIDYATDAKIQDTLRDIRDSTVITIAHRLQTIVDYDVVLVLEKGEVAEFGPPWQLIVKEDGVFRGMCESSGDIDTLLEMAKKAEMAGRLVELDEGI